MTEDWKSPRYPLDMKSVGPKVCFNGPRRGWEDNIRMDTGWEVVDWIHLDQDRD